MATVIALGNIIHDGKDYSEGDSIEIKSQAQVEQLEAAGAVIIKGKKSVTIDAGTGDIVDDANPAGKTGQ